MKKGEFYTENELYQKIDILEKEKASLQDYIRLLEGTLNDYKRKKQGEVVDRLTKENLQYKLKIQEKDKKIGELAKDLEESKENINNLEKRLDNALSAINQFTDRFKIPSSNEIH